MCANYQPAQNLHLHFRTQAPTFEYGRDLYPMQFGPILVRDDSTGDERVSHRAMFGMVPFWAKDTKLARQTYNARSETVAEKPSFRSAWKRRQFCLIPVQGIYEPNYESGKPVRWRIHRVDDAAFALAGIFESCPAKDGEGTLRSFSMLTVNAGEHPLMKRFHAPGDEKRSVVVVPTDACEDWLGAQTDSEARAFLVLFDPGQFSAEPAPRGAAKNEAA